MYLEGAPLGAGLAARRGLAIAAFAPLVSGCGGGCGGGTVEVIEAPDSGAAAEAQAPDVAEEPDSGLPPDAGADATLDAVGTETSVDAPPVETGAPDATGPEGGDAPDDDVQDAGLIVIGNGSVLPGSVDFDPSDDLYLAVVTAPPAPAHTTLVDLATIAQPGQGDAGIVQMGLYSDDGGFPETLLASTPAFRLVPGPNAIGATPSIEIAGNGKYWVALLATSGPGTIRLYQTGGTGLPNEDLWETPATALPPAFPVNQAVPGSSNLNLFLFVGH
ncbi:MAG: hypothetical protein ACRENE_23455 [Polyangiaceae bacterium]